MFLSVIHFFNVLIFLDLLLAIVCAVLLIKTPTKYAVKFISIPLIFLVTFILLVEGEKLLGRPYDVFPVGKFEFISYRVAVVDGTKKIELWVLQNNKSRLHIVDYTEEFEQELSKATTRKNKGMRGRGEFSTNPEGRMPDLSIGDIPREEILIPKEQLPEPKQENKEEIINEWKYNT